MMEVRSDTKPETMSSTGYGTGAKPADKTLHLYEIMHNKLREIRRH